MCFDEKRHIAFVLDFIISNVDSRIFGSFPNYE